MLRENASQTTGEEQRLNYTPNLIRQISRAPAYQAMEVYITVEEASICHVQDLGAAQPADSRYLLVQWSDLLRYVIVKGLLVLLYNTVRFEPQVRSRISIC